MAVALGCIGEFNEAGERWPLYIGRLNQVFLANDIASDQKKRAIFLSVVGAKTFELLYTLLSPETPDTKPFQELVDILSHHFSPAPSEIIERFKFNSRVRHSDESITTYVSELRRLAKFCNFGETLETMLRDRLVCGVQDNRIQTRLLAESGLTLEKALQISIAMESATKDALDLQSMSNSGQLPVHKVHVQHSHKGQKFKPKPNNKPPVQSTAFTKSKQGGELRPCIRCGDTRHKPPDCMFINSECFNCGRTGHLANRCLSVPRKYRTPNFKSSHVHTVQEPSSTVVSNEPSRKEYDHIFRVSDELTRPPEPHMLQILINKEMIPMELDTGASYSLIGEETYNRLVNKPPLEEANTKLQSFTGHTITVLGCIKVQVQLKATEASVKLPLLVVAGRSANLCGRNWISILKLISTRVHQVTPKRTLQSVLDAHKAVFEPAVGCMKNVKAHLSVKEGAKPVFCKPRTIPYAMKDKVEQELDRLTKLGIIEPVTYSEWAAPIVPVLKSDKESVRICGNFKLTVNPVANVEKYPLPRADDIFSKLAGGKKFSKLDLREAYNQIELDEESKKLVVINTHKGLYRYNRLPFGISSATAIFQRQMDTTLQDIDQVSAFLDDVLITGGDDDSHLEHLDKTLTKVEEAGLKLKLEKCKFFEDSIVFLGNRLDAEGLRPDENKMTAIRDAPAPTSVHELRSFLGLISYYSKFLPKMADLLAPLYALLQKDSKWKWASEEEETFQKVKSVLQNSSLLVHYDPKRPVALACDASPVGVGAVLLHMDADIGQPIAFASRSLSSAEKNYPQIEREALAIVFGVSKFRDYLLGRHFFLYTDHKPLVTLFSENKGIPGIAAARIQRWALVLSAYTYTIKYKKGTDNCDADCLSRLPIPVPEFLPPQPAELVLLTEVVNTGQVNMSMLELETSKDPQLSKVLQHIHQDWKSNTDPELDPYWKKRHELSIVGRALERGNRVVIPEKLRPEVLTELHSAHQGIAAMKALARSKFWWPKIDLHIEQVVKDCLTCQVHAHMPPANKEFHWPKDDKPWTRVHLDYAGPIDGKMILVIVDPTTNWIEAIAVTNATAAITVSTIRQVFARFGLPKCIVIDNGSTFTGEDFCRFTRENGIEHLRTAPYHPCSNGVAEKAVQTIKSGLKKLQGGSLSDKLAKILLAHHRSPSPESMISPAEKMFGRTIRTRLDLVTSEPKKNPEADPVSKTGVKSLKTEDVWFRNFGKGDKWLPGTVQQKLGKTMFLIKPENGNSVVRRHLDQVRQRSTQCLIKDKTPIIPEKEEDPFSFFPLQVRPRARDIPRTPLSLVRRSTRVRKKPVRWDI